MASGLGITTGSLRDLGLVSYISSSGLVTISVLQIPPRVTVRVKKSTCVSRIEVHNSHSANVAFFFSFLPWVREVEKRTHNEKKLRKRNLQTCHVECGPWGEN